jgi:Superfamily II DNA helicase
MKVPAYVICQQKALMGMVNWLPDSPRAWELIPYCGAIGVVRYVLEILGIIRKYMAENSIGEAWSISDM